MLKSRCLWILVCSGLLVYTGCGAPGNAVVKEEEASYFGIQAQEYSFTYNSEILVSKSHGEPTVNNITDDVKYAAKYALGRMHNEGSIHPDMKIKLLKFAIEDKNPDYYRVSYTLTSKAVLARNLKQYTFYIPVMPYYLYTRVGKSTQCHHKDEDQVHEGNFWYQWDPNIPGCLLKENIDYFKVTAQITPVVVPNQTFPEYPRLVQNGEVRVTAFFGAADYDNKDWNPDTSPDQAAKAYRQMEYFMTQQLGFKFTPMSEAEIRRIYNPALASYLPQGKTATLQTRRGLIKVRMLFLETGFSKARSDGFHFFLQDALKNDSLIIYEGHSGIGHNLHLKNIEKKRKFKFKFNPNYQVIFFGSCLPYGYYSQMYFDRKATDQDPLGTKNLDIIAYAKESHFGNMETNHVMRFFTNAFRMGFTFSYQDMINPTGKDYLGVIGDEDNPQAGMIIPILPGK